jgi:hypothetical protein
MSTATASAPRTPSRPAARAAARRRPSLVEVPAATPSVAGNGMFAVVVVGLLLAGMAVLLVLNTSLSSGAFEIGALTRTQNQLAVQEQQLLQRVALEESPESLQHRADLLGMVPVTAPVFLRLADGKVLGTPVAAVGVRPTVPANPATAVYQIPSLLAGATTVTRPGAGTGTTATGATAAGTPLKPAAKPHKASGDAAVADPSTSAAHTSTPTARTTTSTPTDGAVADPGTATRTTTTTQAGSTAGGRP